MQTAVDTLSGVFKGCEGNYDGFERAHASGRPNSDSYAGSGSYGYSFTNWFWDPPTPPQASRSIREAPVMPPRGRLAVGGAKCDKCDGPHDTSVCPHFNGPRDEHQDAWSHYSKAAASGHAHHKARECVAPRSLPRGAASVVRMPGDGSCLFHSIAYGLGAFGCQEDGYSIRQRVSNFIAQKPECQIGGTPLSSWVNWDSGVNVSSYCSRLSAGGFWGGAIEMAACAQIFSVDVAVYEQEYYSGAFNRISDFLCDVMPRGAVLLVYSGRAHYDALRVQNMQGHHNLGSADHTSKRHEQVGSRARGPGQGPAPRRSNDVDDDNSCAFM